MTMAFVDRFIRRPQRRKTGNARKASSNRLLMTATAIHLAICRMSTVKPRRDERMSYHALSSRRAVFPWGEAGLWYCNHEDRNCTKGTRSDGHGRCGPGLGMKTRKPDEQESNCKLAEEDGQQEE